MSNINKERLNKVYALCDKIDKNTKKQPTAREQLRNGLSYFLMYLAASDGGISWQRADFISEIYEIPLTSNEIETIIKTINQELDTCSLKFKEVVPPILKIFVGIDKHFNIKRKGPDALYCYRLLIILFEEMGIDLLHCNNDVTDKELHALDFYLNNMRNYAIRELFGPEGDNNASDGTAFIGGKR